MRRGERRRRGPQGPCLERGENGALAPAALAGDPGPLPPEVFELAAGGAVALDGALRIVAANEGFAELYDAGTPRAVLGMGFVEVVRAAWERHAGDRQHMDDALASLARQDALPGRDV